MKTLGRILIIVASFVLVMGITYVIVNANSSSAASPAFERGAEGIAQPDGERPALPSGERPDFDGGDLRGGSWTFGLLKNLGIIALVVSLIVLPKGFIRSMRRKTAPVD